MTNWSVHAQCGREVGLEPETIRIVDLLIDAPYVVSRSAPQLQFKFPSFATRTQDWITDCPQAGVAALAEQLGTDAAVAATIHYALVGAQREFKPGSRYLGEKITSRINKRLRKLSSVAEITGAVTTASEFFENKHTEIREALEQAASHEKDGKPSCDTCGSSFESAPLLYCDNCGVLLGGWPQIVHNEAKRERKDRYNQRLSGHITEHNQRS